MLLVTYTGVALLGAALITAFFKIYSLGRTITPINSDQQRTLKAVPYVKYCLIGTSEEDIVLTKTQVKQKHLPHTWQRQAFDNFVSIIRANEYGMKTFPCVYATAGYRGNEHYYCFLRPGEPSDASNVHLMTAALIKYLSVARKTGPNTSLVIMASPPPPSIKSPKSVMTVDDHLQTYWKCLRGLRHYDPEPWPKDYPEDTDGERWCFCFMGVPLFMVAMTPAHEKRQSRYAANFCIVIQPKWLFDTLFSTQEKRHAACKKVRGLVADFDSIPLSPDVTDYGEKGSSEARQYYLLDENVSSVCPYKSLSR